MWENNLNLLASNPNGRMLPTRRFSLCSPAAGRWRDKNWPFFLKKKPRRVVFSTGSVFENLYYISSFLHMQLLMHRCSRPNRRAQLRQAGQLLMHRFGSGTAATSIACSADARNRTRRTGTKPQSRVVGRTAGTPGPCGNAFRCCDRIDCRWGWPHAMQSIGARVAPPPAYTCGNEKGTQKCSVSIVLTACHLQVQGCGSSTTF
jgi:hypothetical protein